MVAARRIDAPTRLAFPSRMSRTRVHARHASSGSARDGTRALPSRRTPPLGRGDRPDRRRNACDLLLLLLVVGSSLEVERLRRLRRGPLPAAHAGREEYGGGPRRDSGMRRETGRKCDSADSPSTGYRTSSPPDPAGVRTPRRASSSDFDEANQVLHLSSLLGLSTDPVDDVLDPYGDLPWPLPTADSREPEPPRTDGVHVPSMPARRSHGRLHPRRQA